MSSNFQNLRRGTWIGFDNWGGNFLALIYPLLLVIVFFNAANAQATAEGLKIGEAAPQLKLTKLLKAPANASASLTDLKGRVVVLDFWATWCAPCIAAMDHLSELSTKFKDKPVQFISITDEDEQRVSWFLKKKSPAGWIGLDEKRDTFNAYKFIGIPHTVIIDAEGKIAAITFSKDVTEAALNDLVAGKNISLPLKQAVDADLEWDNDLVGDNTLFQVIIKPSYAYTGGMSPKPGRLTFDGAPLQALIQTAFQMPSTRVVNKLSESENKQAYRVSVAVPKGKESLLYPTFQRILQDTFSLRINREMREIDVFLLKPIAGNNTILKPSQLKESEYSFMRGKISGKSQPMSKLAEVLENFARKPVIDVTGLGGKYDWNLSYSYADKNILLEGLRKEMGLELVAAKRSVEILIVDKEPLGQ